jgi:hypothetical protein
MPAKIEVYSQDGVLMKTIVIPERIPDHAVGQVVVPSQT